MKAGTLILLKELINRYPALLKLRKKIIYCVETVVRCYCEHGKVLTAGNGGSAADALHIVGELMKSFKLPRPLSLEDKVYSDYLNQNLQQGLPAIALVSETALLTAWLNDAEPNLIFAQQIHVLGRPGDVFIALSTSGNSPNIVYAAEAARARGISVVALTGESGGRMADCSDVLLNVPAVPAEQVQELQLPLYHILCAAIENELFGV